MWQFSVRLAANEFVFITDITVFISVIKNAAKIHNYFFPHLGTLSLMKDINMNYWQQTSEYVDLVSEMYKDG